MTLNTFLIHIFYLGYVASICWGASVFYSQILTPKHSVSSPQKSCFLLSFILTSGTVFVFFNSSILSSLWFLVCLALPVPLFFQERPALKVATGFFVLLIYSFTEIAGFALLSIINLFVPKMNLIPINIALSGNLFLSFITFTLNTLIYILLLHILSRALKHLLTYFRPRLGILLAFPFFIAIINVGTLNSIDSHRKLIVYTPLLLLFLACTLFLLNKGLKEFQIQKRLSLQAKNQRTQTEQQLLYYKKLEVKYTSLRTWRHDLANHLTIITLLLENKRYNEIEKYLEELL